MRPLCLLLLLLLAISGCATAPPGTCPPGLERAEVVQLFFGRNIGGAEGVSDAEFAAFAAEELTPRFPDGLTILDARGQWRGADGAILGERAKLVVIVGQDPAVLDRAAEVRAAYKTRFRQEAVLELRQAACVGW